MALQPGTKADPNGNPHALSARLGRAVGFATLAGMALATLAGVVLLPARAQLADAQYQRDCLAAMNADARAVIAARQRLIDALPTDSVLAMRLARSQLEMLPAGEIVVVDPQRPAAEPLVSIDPTPRPDPPDGWLYRSGLKFQDPAFRRGSLLLAGGAMLAAMLLFAVPLRKR